MGGDKIPIVARRADPDSDRKQTTIAPRLGALLVLFLLLSACVVGGTTKDRPEPTNVAATPTPRVVSRGRDAVADRGPVKRVVEVAEAPPGMAAAIDGLLFGERGVYGVVVMAADGSLLYSRNADTPFIAASLYKLLLMADCYRARETGALKFDEIVTLDQAYFPNWPEPSDSYFDPSYAGTTATVQDALYAMVTYSSNVAAKALLAHTDEASLAATAVELGLANTHILVNPAELSQWPPASGADANPAQIEQALGFVAQSASDGPVNITTPWDIASFFALLLQGKVVSPEASAEMVGLLKQQMVDNRFPVLLPGGTELAHKTGNLEHVVHDAGIIYTPEGPVILAALVENTPDDAHTTEIVQRLALIAYGQYELPPFTASGAAGADSAPK